MDESLVAIILAAGKGTRMNSDLPKVAHEAAGRPMVEWVARACAEAGCARILVVVGHGQGLIREILAGVTGVEFVEQREQLGTGHAVQQCRPALDGFTGDVIVLAGDGPLVRGGSLRRLVERHRAAGASATLATAEIDDPSGYGRILRDNAGAFLGVVEEKNATDAQRAIREVNPSVYCFNAPSLFDALARVERNPVSGEFYLTDAPALIARAGGAIDAARSLAPDEALSVNTPEQLARVDAILRARLERAGAA
ncbi:MAG: glycosyl transferase family 2 [Planctomycetota bacterium]|nr:MAG: glycosyl transferase family 2 [Planctomycetota bacterium]